MIAEGQRGFDVAPVSEDDLREIAALRLLLEGARSNSLSAAAMSRWEAALMAAHYKLARMEEVMATGDTSEAEDWKRCDWGVPSGAYRRPAAHAFSWTCIRRSSTMSSLSDGRSFLSRQRG